MMQAPIEIIREVAAVHGVPSHLVLGPDRTARTARIAAVRAVVKRRPEMSCRAVAELFGLHHETVRRYAAEILDARHAERVAALLAAREARLRIRKVSRVLPMPAFAHDIAAEHGVSIDDVLTRSRKRAVKAARKAITRAVAQHYPDASSKTLGHLFQRHHTTILHTLGHRASRIPKGEGRL